MFSGQFGMGDRTREWTRMKYLYGIVHNITMNCNHIINWFVKFTFQIFLLLPYQIGTVNNSGINQGEREKKKVGDQNGFYDYPHI